MLSISPLGNASARHATKAHGSSILKHTGASVSLFEETLIEALMVALCGVRSGQVSSVMQILMVDWEKEREAVSLSGDEYKCVQGITYRSAWLGEISNTFKEEREAWGSAVSLSG